MTGASFEEDGGAVNNSGILTIKNCLIKGNSAKNGAGIYNTGTLSISNSEISGNTVNGLGGGIYNHFASLTMTNCTISGNSSQIYGGGIVNYFSSLTISNSIITFNRAAFDADIYNIVNAKLGNNLVKGIFSTNNIIGLDPGFIVAPVFQSGKIANLDELDLSLNSTSWAIDRGDNNFVETEFDLTGHSRIFGAWSSETTVDIGAYEYQGLIDKEAETPSTVVTTAEDIIDDTDNLISLREAILYSSVGDTVTFDQSLKDQVITLVSKQIVIDKALSIDASGINCITINANGSSSVFDVIAGTEETPVKLTNLVITGGRVQYVGGGINNSGNLHIINSKIEGNHAGYGAGIYNEGTLRAVNVEIAGNTASNYGGGIFNNYDVTLVNATVTNNKATNTGSGIHNQETMSVYNSIVVLNGNGEVDSDIFHLEREVLNGYNTLSTFTEWTNATDCREYDPASPLFNDPENSDYSLAVNSQAVNAGNNDYVTAETDLAGNIRILYGIVDLGAYEWHREDASTVVTTLEDVIDETDGFISLREAVSLYAVEGDTVTFDPSLAGGTITLNGDQFEITKGISIDASAIGGITIDANGESPVFNVSGGTEEAPVELINLTITGSSAVNDKGGAIYNSGTLSVANCIITGNSANYGSGIYNYFATLTVTNTEISGNTANNVGGGIYNYSGTLSVTNSTISGNAAKSFGGGISNYFGVSNITNTIVAQNFAASFGSDVYNIGMPISGDNNIIGLDPGFAVAPVFESGRIANLDELDLSLNADSWAIDHGNNGFVETTLDITGNSRISGAWKSEATVDIGAYEYQGQIEKEAETPSLVVTTALDVVDDTDNLISLREAVLYASSGDTITFDESLTDQTITLSNGEIIVDRAVSIDASARGIAVDAGGRSRVFNVMSGTNDIPVELTGLTISGGRSQYEGGGIYNSGILVITNATISQNSATFGGGVLNCGTLTIVNTEISGNMAGGGYGGGIFNNNDGLTAINVTVSGNFAYHKGGGIYNQETMSIFNSIVALNTAREGDPDIFHLKTESLSGYNTLTSFLSWTESSNCIIYDPYLPLFADADGGDYSLIDLSQALNVGDNSYVTTDTDCEGNRRIMFGRVDLGAYEFQRESYAGVVTTLEDIVDETDCLISLREAVTIYAKKGDTITFDDELAGGTIYLAGTEIVIDKGIAIDASSVAGITIDANGGSRIFNVTAGDADTVDLIGLILTGGNADEGGAVINAGTLKLTNLLITGNNANLGGALCNGKDGTIYLYNNTITGNGAASGGGFYNTGTAYFYNTIVVGNIASELGYDIANADGAIYADSTLSTYAHWTSSSNCPLYDSARPLFTDPENGDYTLADESQGINAGNNTYAKNLTDLAGYQRISHGNVDLGAYESAKMLALLAGEGNNYVSYGANRQQLVWGRILNVIGYEMIYSQDGGESWFKVETKAPNVVITGLTYGANVLYRVRALKIDGFTYTEWSDPKSFNVCPMDINGDGDISPADRVLLSRLWLSEEGDSRFQHYGDVDGDGEISNADRAYVGRNWLRDSDDDRNTYPLGHAADIVFATYESGDLEVDLDIF